MANKDVVKNKKITQEDRKYVLIRVILVVLVVAAIITTIVVIANKLKKVKGAANDLLLFDPSYAEILSADFSAFGGSEKYRLTNDEMNEIINKLKDGEDGFIEEIPEYKEDELSSASEILIIYRDNGEEVLSVQLHDSGAYLVSFLKEDMEEPEPENDLFAPVLGEDEDRTSDAVAKTFKFKNKNIENYLREFVQKCKDKTKKSDTNTTENKTEG